MKLTKAVRLLFAFVVVVVGGVVVAGAGLGVGEPVASAQSNAEKCRQQCFSIFPSDPAQIPNSQPSCRSSSVKTKWPQFCRYQSCLSTCQRGLLQAAARRRLAADNNAFNRAVRSNTVVSYRSYLKRYPRGRHRQAALMRIRDVKIQSEERDFRKAQRRNTSSAYRRYLRMYPRGRHRQRANTRLRQLTSQEDDRAYRYARQRNSLQSYSNYVNRWPRGRYVGEARGVIRTFRARARVAHQLQKAKAAKAHRQRYARLARQMDSKSRGYKAKGVLRLLGGFALAGGGIAIWVTNAIGDILSGSVGGASIGFGIVMVAINGNWRKARNASWSARDYRRQMRRYRHRSDYPVTAKPVVALSHRWQF